MKLCKRFIKFILELTETILINRKEWKMFTTISINDRPMTQQVSFCFSFVFVWRWNFLSPSDCSISIVNVQQENSSLKTFRNRYGSQSSSILTESDENPTSSIDSLAEEKKRPALPELSTLGSKLTKATRKPSFQFDFEPINDGKKRQNKSSIDQRKKHVNTFFYLFSFYRIFPVFHTNHRRHLITSSFIFWQG